MSHLANALSELLIEYNMTAADLSRASGIRDAQISRLRNGIQVWISGDGLMRLARGFCPASDVQAGKAHAKLLYARLHDECTGCGAKFISIKLDIDSELKDSPPAANGHKPVLPPKLQRHLEVLENHVAENRHVRDMVGILANFCQCGAPSS